MTEMRDRIAALSPEQRAVLESRLASLAAAKGSAPKERIEPRDRDRPAPVSYAQQREWALERFRPSNNIGGALRLQGKVDLDLLSKVLTEVMARHEVLRTTLETVDGQLVQVVHPVTPIPVAAEDISTLEPQARQARIRQCHDDEVLRPFDPAAPQRMRATALRLSDEEYVAVMSTHHASADGWSMAIVLREVAVLYPAFREGLPSPLPDPAIQYGDFAVWQRRHLDQTWMDKELGWWRQTLADLPPRLALPFDKPYPTRRSFEGRHYSLTIEGERNLALQRFAEGEGVAISMVLLALCSTVLHRYTGQEDQVFGTAVTGRVRTETEHVVGCFANALPLRIRLSGDDTLVGVLRRAKEVFSSAFDHQEIPFDTLVEELAPREASQVPLIQMMINVLTTPGDILRLEDQVLDMPGLRVTPLAMDPGWVPVDIILNVQVQPDRVSLQWHYGSELFDDRTVIGLADRVQHTLDQLLAAPDTRVADVDLMLEESAAPAKSAGVAGTGSGSGAAEADATATVVDRFQEQADLAPTAAAVVCGATTLSYAELNQQANRLAHRLRALGVGPDTPVGILLERTALLPAAVLAVLKAGGAFLPLDTAYPPDRIAATLTDSGAPVLLTTSALAPMAAGAELRTLMLDDPEAFDGAETDPTAPPRAAHAAYLIYTSGSTGTPKGVVVEHGSLAVFAEEVADRLRLGPADRFLQFASPGFDVLAEELFPVWLAGGAVVIPPEPVAGAALDLIELADRDHLTVMELPAAYWHEWVREIERTKRRIPAGLRTVIVGAERVLPERLRTWRGFGRPLVHVYGITETTVSSTFFTLKPSSPDADLRHLPIGTALPSARLRILDEALRPVPPGAVGELYIGGISVARGYHGRFGLTATRFIADPDPACPGARAYRTGDLVRQRSDGNLEFVARADTQIKIRGYRVEPAEIESALCRHPQVAQAAVTVYEPAPDDRRLAAYIVPQPRTRPNITDLRRFLGRELPPYLVPSAYVLLESIPVTDNGKVDRDRLPAPSEERPDIAEEMVPPATPLEALLADIVAAVLGVTQVGTNDNFFELGGDSILAIQVVARAQEQGVGLSPLDLFEHPTVKLLAATAQSSDTDRRIKPRAADAPPVLSFDQERLWLEDKLVSGAAYQIGGRLRLTGPLRVDVLESSIRAILHRHEILRSKFPVVGDGPVQVVDYSGEQWQLAVEDLTPLPEDDRLTEARRLADEQSSAKFDLGAGPLFRCLLLRLNDDDHMLSITSHHIVSDMSSLGLFLSELKTLYEAGGDASTAELPELPVQYLDYALWQRDWLSGETLQQEVGFWRDHLAGAPAAITLPALRTEESDTTPVGGRFRGQLSSADTVALRALCRQRGVTSFMVVLAALSTVLNRWSGQDDVVVGVSISTRTDAGTDRLIGCFINTLPLHVSTAGRPAFTELLGRARQVALDGYAHAAAPFDLLVQELNVPRDPRHTPLFQVYLNVIDIPLSQRIGDVDLRIAETPALPTSFDVVVTAQEMLGVFCYELTYDARRYGEAMMGALTQQFEEMLRGVVADPGRGIYEYVLGSAGAEDAVDMNSATVEPADIAFDKSSAAVVDGSGAWSHAWLAAASEAVARRVADVGGEADSVGVVRRSRAGFAAAVAGCAKAGVSYTVVAPDADVSGFAAVLDADSSELSSLLPGRETAISADLPHRDWTARHLGLTAADRIAVLTPNAHHLASALSAAAASGAAVHLSDAPDLDALAAWLADASVTVVYATPQLLRAVATRTKLPALRHVLIDNPGGLLWQDVDTAHSLSDACRCTTLYGVGADGRPLAAYDVPPDWREHPVPARVPLGDAAGDAASVLLPGGAPAAVGEVGELWFGTHRTGDLARRWTEGTLEHVGAAA